MSKCTACEDLRNDAPNFATNGVTDTVCTNLQNDNGFDNCNSKNNDCTDLNNANDCLVGNMGDMVDAYDTCDWKEYMKKFVPNVYNVLKAIICAICGIWKAVHKLECQVDKLASPQTFDFGEEDIVTFNGITFDKGSAAGLEYLPGMHGNSYAAYLSGTVILSDFFEGHTGGYRAPGVLLYEYRIKKNKAPYLLRAWNGNVQNANGGPFIEGHVMVFYPGQIPWNASDGDQTNPGRSPVPDNYIYIQVRLVYSDTLHEGYKVTPSGVIPVLLDIDADC